MICSFSTISRQIKLCYRNTIAGTIQEYNTGIAVPDGNLPNQVYTDLAWGGLMDAPVFNITFPPGSAESIRIKNRYAPANLLDV